MTSRELSSEGAIAGTLSSLMKNYLEKGEWWLVIGAVYDKEIIAQIIQEAHSFGIRLPEEAINFLNVSVNPPDRDYYNASLILQLVGLKNSQVRERHILKEQAINPDLVQEDIFIRWADLMSLGTFDSETLHNPSVVK